MGWSIDEIKKWWRNFLYNKKYLYLTQYLTQYARFVPARILFPLAVKVDYQWAKTTN
jgi:hypothetical protein